MASYDVPVPPTGSTKYTVRVELPGGGFRRLLYKWNQRDGSWYVDIADDSGIALVRSRRIVLGTDTFRPFMVQLDMQGTLSVVDTTGENVQPLKDELGDRTRFRYTV